jgi:hypothetical protein
MGSSWDATNERKQIQRPHGTYTEIAAEFTERKEVDSRRLKVEGSEKKGVSDSRFVESAPGSGTLFAKV